MVRSKNAVSAICLGVFISWVIGITLVATESSAQADASSATFSQIGGVVSAVDANAKTATIKYAVVQLGCPYPTCSGGGEKNGTIRQGDVLIIDALDQVVNDITKIKAEDPVIVYFRSESSSRAVGTDSSPYAVKVTSLVPPGCDPITKVCTGRGEGTIGTSTPLTFPPPILSRDLGMGVQNYDVAALQQKLQALGYLPKDTAPTGYFGPLTKKAVIDFQRTYGLPATGFVGPLTRGALGQR